MEYATAYCSNAAEIIEAYDAPTVSLIMDKGIEEFDVGDFGTTVHEGLHSYDSDLSEKHTNDLIDAEESWNGWLKAYFVNTKVILTPERHKVFKTSLLHADYFPDSVKRLARYDTYIQEWEGEVSDANSKLTLREVRAYGVEEFKNGEARSTSNVQGLYGLLEEFNAYHHGAKAQFEVMSQAPDIETSGSTNLLNSYYEFNIFMAYYLKYARENRKDIYAIFIGDTELRTAYTLIELSWRELVTNIYSNKKSTRHFNSWKGEYDLYTAELREVMNEFMVPTSELGEYASYAASKKYDLTLIEQAIKKTGDFEVKEWSWGDDDDDFDWDDDDDWEWDESDETEIDISTEEMDHDYFYVVTADFKEASEASTAFLKAQSSYSESGMYKSFYGNYNVFIGKFKDRRQAIELSKKAKEEFPKVRVE